MTEVLDPAQMKLQTQAVALTAPLQVKAVFHKERDTVLVNVEAGSAMDLTCGRCLAVIGQPYDGHFDLDYSVKGQVSLDVTDDIRQEVLLSYPFRFLCREDCPGLCPQCGVNLNEGLCTHATTQA